MSKASLFCYVLLGLMLLTQAHENVDKIKFYELQKGNLHLNLSNYGASIIACIVPDKHGKLADVALGYDSIDSYKKDTVYFGALIGRVANRIGGAKFSLDGKTYKLPANDHGNTLHGGTIGFGDVVWKVKSHKDSHITFTYDSFDGEQGFPGELKVTVTYLLSGENNLGVEMTAKPVDKATPVNLAQHTYWNLRGHNSGDILSHEVQIFGSQITPVDKDLIPTGKLQSVKGTPYDFLKPKEVGKQIHDLPGLYDINYVLDKNDGSKKMTKVAIVRDPVSGRKMEILANQVGVQFYTSGMLKPTVGKGGSMYNQYAGIALETQGFPDSVNNPNFPSQIVKPGKTYKHHIVYRFTAN